MKTLSRLFLLFAMIFGAITFAPPDVIAARVGLKPVLVDPRFFRTAPITLYVNATSGSDVTGTGEVGAPFASIQKALDQIPDYWVATVTVQMAAETITGTTVTAHLRARPGITSTGGTPAVHVVGACTAADVIFTNTSTANAVTTTVGWRSLRAYADIGGGAYAATITEGSHWWYRPSLNQSFSWGAIVTSTQPGLTNIISSGQTRTNDWVCPYQTIVSATTFTTTNMIAGNPGVNIGNITFHGIQFSARLLAQNAKFLGCAMKGASLTNTVRGGSWAGGYSTFKTIFTDTSVSRSIFQNATVQSDGVGTSFTDVRFTGTPSSGGTFLIAGSISKTTGCSSYTCASGLTMNFVDVDTSVNSVTAVTVTDRSTADIGNLAVGLTGTDSRALSVSRGASVIVSLNAALAIYGLVTAPSSFRSGSYGQVKAAMTASGSTLVNSAAAGEDWIVGGTAGVADAPVALASLPVTSAAELVFVE